MPLNQILQSNSCQLHKLNKSLCYWTDSILTEFEKERERQRERDYKKAGQTLQISLNTVKIEDTKGQTSEPQNAFSQR